jgi:hypothetical protein
MPRIANANHRIQHAFVPLVFRTHFQPERLLTTPLPWNISYPPHGDGKPADDTPPAMDQGPSADKAPLTKIRRPLGEPGRNEGCTWFVGRNVWRLIGRFVLNFFPAISHPFNRKIFTSLLQNIWMLRKQFRISHWINSVWSLMRGKTYALHTISS